MNAALNPPPAAGLARASLDRLDAVASAMERRWGIGRLPKLVDANLAVRFASQRQRLDAAISADVPAVTAVQAEAMLRAWQALDAAAAASGWQPLSPAIWETVLPGTGEIVAIVRDADDAQAVARTVNGTVWTLAEVAIAIEAFGDGVRAAKRAFPAAEVTAVRSPARPSLAIGAAAPGAGMGKPGRNPAGRSRRSLAAGFPGPATPLADPRPATPSAMPPVDWARGDELPF